MSTTQTKKKVIVTKEEMIKIQNLKRLALMSSNPTEVRLFRLQMNTIIDRASSRMENKSIYTKE